MSVASGQALPINWSPIGKLNLTNPTYEMPNDRDSKRVKVKKCL